jgi:hypothetical protein
MDFPHGANMAHHNEYPMNNSRLENKQLSLAFECSVLLACNPFVSIKQGKAMDTAQVD